MERHVAVQVQFPRLSYVELFPLNGRQHSQLRLSPIEVDQRVAVVKLFLMHSQEATGGAVSPERELHAFRISPLPAGADTGAVLRLDAEYDGVRTVRFRIAGGGISPQTADIRVPRPRRRWWLLLLLLFLLFLGVGSMAVVRTVSQPGREEPPLAVEEGSAPSDGSEELVQEPELPRIDLEVYFEPNRTGLTGAARRELDELVPALRKHPQEPVSIVGHTALYGTEAGRMEISRGRAQGVASYLRSQGWEPQADSSVRWVGSQDPVTREPDSQHRNRRVEVFVGKDQSSR
ncbi:MAG: OmpA family protein [Alkalispirochaeta sp.]